MRFQLSRKFAVFAALTLAWMVVIFLFSAQNADDSSDTSGRVISFLCGLVGYTPSDDAKELLSFCVRKAAHMTEFGLLGVLCLRTLREGFGDSARRWPAAFALASCYAATDEFHQLFVEGRSGQVTDWLIDSTGILLWLLMAWGITLITDRVKQSKNNKS